MSIAGQKPKPKPNKWSLVLAVLGILWALGALITGNVGGALAGLMVAAAAGVPFIIQANAQKREQEAADAAARQAREKAEAAAVEEQRLADEEERRFEAEQATMKETSTRRRLLSQVNELVNYANRLHANGDNRQVILTMMEAVGQFASYGDSEDHFFREPAVAHDITLFFEQLERMGLQHEIVYRRARRVLRQERSSEAVDAKTMNRSDTGDLSA